MDKTTRCESCGGWGFVCKRSNWPLIGGDFCEPCDSSHRMCATVECSKCEGTGDMVVAADEWGDEETVVEVAQPWALESSNAPTYVAPPAGRWDNDDLTVEIEAVVL